MSWLFYSVMCVYIVYNLMWVVGITFSYSKNDSPKELFYILFTFIVDVPIIWYLSKNLRIGVALLVAAILLSVVDGIVQQWLEGINVAVLWWYAPKIIPITAAILLNRLTCPVQKRTQEGHSA
jgi:hypothetical protein